jgi:uncharacterized membrane protein YfcA
VIDVATFTSATWALVVLAAVLLGFSKTAVGGISMVSVAIFAAVLPARASTGLVLLLFLVGDVFALRAYTRFTEWAVLRSLAPAVAVGIAVGALFLFVAADLAVRRTIGVILLVLVAVATVQKVRRRGDDDDPGPASTALMTSTGAVSGFTSMVANAGGAIMSLYLLRLRLPVMVFLGTTAWFFFVINVVKVPISLGLGLLDWSTARATLLLSPAVVVGALAGRAVARRMSLATFEWVILTVTFAAALNLLR